MAVQIPPWLQIDPIAPARIALQANQQRIARDAAANANQARFAEMQLRREQMAQQGAQSERRLAAQERAQQRRDAVFRQTRDEELAQTAANMQLRREAQAAKTEQFQQTLRLKQQKAEQEVKDAAEQMQAMREVGNRLQAGESMQKILPDVAPRLFKNRPAAAVSAIQKGITAPTDLVARELTDESGKGLGIRVIPGAGGTLKETRRQSLGPEGVLNTYRLELADVHAQLMMKPKDPELLRVRARIMNDIKELRSRRGAVPLPPGVLPGAPASAPAPSSGFVPGQTTQAPVAAPAADDMIMLQSPDGKTGRASRAEWEAAPAEEKKGWKEVTPGKLDEEAEAEDEAAFEDEAMADEEEFAVEEEE